jgi:hypothetical protein
MRTHQINFNTLKNIEMAGLQVALENRGINRSDLGMVMYFGDDFGVDPERYADFDDLESLVGFAEFMRSIQGR